MGPMELGMDDKRVRAALAAGKKLGANAVYRLRQTVDDLGLHVMKRAQKRAPLDEGHLRRGFTTVTSLKGPDLVTTVATGGLAAAYAEVQHEREDFTHKVGMDHFLYGKDYSAWNRPEQRLFYTLTTKTLVKEFEKAFSQGGGI